MVFWMIFFVGLIEVVVMRGLLLEVRCFMVSLIWIVIGFRELDLLLKQLLFDLFLSQLLSVMILLFVRFDRMGLLFWPRFLFRLLRFLTRLIILFFGSLLFFSWSWSSWFKMLVFRLFFTFLGLFSRLFLLYFFFLFSIILDWFARNFGFGFRFRSLFIFGFFARWLCLALFLLLFVLFLFW